MRVVEYTQTSAVYMPSIMEDDADDFPERRPAQKEEKKDA
jgi:hypothetical protein